MQEDTHIRLLPERIRMRRFLTIAVLLALLLPLTWIGRTYYVDRVAEQPRSAQHAGVTEALNRIEADFDELQAELLERAEAVAVSPAVVRGLRRHLRGESGGSDDLVAFFAGLEVPSHVSLELYDVTPHLVAWNGFSMPLDEGPTRRGFLESFGTTTATDEGIRQALVVWIPVREGTRVLGAVRAMHLIKFDAPVRNEYLRDVSLVEEWRRLTRLPVAVAFHDSVAESRLSGRKRLLEGADGTVLGRVSVAPPTVDQLAAETAGRFDDVLAFWAVLLMFWLMGGVWYAYRQALHRLPERPGGRKLGRALGWFGAAAALWWGLRFALLALEVPGRWQQDQAPLAPLFDPIHLASGFGGGLMRSTGDFLLSAVFLLVFAVALIEITGTFRDRSAYLYRLHRGLRPPGRSRATSMLASVGAVAAGTLVIEGLTLVLIRASQRAVLDSTFDFFTREALLPEALPLVVYSTLIVTAIGVILISVAVVWMVASTALRQFPDASSPSAFWLSAALGVMIPLIVLYSSMPIGSVAPWPVSLSLLAVAFAVATFLMLRQGELADLFILRSVLPSIFLVTVLLYPMLFSGMDAKRRDQMVDAADTFAEGRDPRVLFAIEQILRDIRSDRRAAGILRSGDPARLDSLSKVHFRGSRLVSLPAYDVNLTFYAEDGRPAGRFRDSGQMLDVSALEQVGNLQSQIILQMYEEAATEDVLVVPITGTREPDRFQYEGITPIPDEGGTPIPGEGGAPDEGIARIPDDGDTTLKDEGGAPIAEENGIRIPDERGTPVADERAVTMPSGEGTIAGWITARAEPQTVLREGGTPFPRVLLPSGSYDDLHANLSVAEFRDGLLVRSMGRDFGRYRLSEDVRQALAAASAVWRNEQVEEQTFRTYYKRRDAMRRSEVTAELLTAASSSVVAVRVPSINTFDHLYYLLRVTIAGLFIGIPLYLFGLYLRHRAGLLPSPHVRFRDKVLNAFLIVGIISVAAVGFVGLEVVTGENERAVQSWLRQHLERVEETLALDARGEEMPYSVLERSRIDSLAAQVGLDVNVYEDYRLVDLSRPQLTQERLIDPRLPIEAYRALFFDGYRFFYTDERVGNFEYTTGYRALPDEQGRPRYVVSVPTLPEQERIEEERARTVAYLFGSLLLLVLVVMFTASLLANAISRPIARLRSGLQAVAAGRFERMLPVNSRDEIGELVRTFNEMQQQLVESRRKLAQQERQLAWREMARQVAHEIKNPLTPMKLSVQHLRRAFADDGMRAEGRRQFSQLFDRITTTLIEQIDTLARIANEFHSFARMPSRIVERLDLNAVVEEAVYLMQEESEVTITLDLSKERLVIEADREELRRIYINLLKNAIQAIPDERQGRIGVRTEFRRGADRQNRAYSTVTDNGTGVEEDARDSIFEPNFSTKTSGTGLGLAIVRKSVEELQGEIGFETEEGKGTTFWITLPLVEDEEYGDAFRDRTWTIEEQER